MQFIYRETPTLGTVFRIVLLYIISTYRGFLYFLFFCCKWLIIHMELFLAEIYDEKRTGIDIPEMPIFFILLSKTQQLTLCFRDGRRSCCSCLTDDWFNNDSLTLSSMFSPAKTIIVILKSHHRGRKSIYTYIPNTCCIMIYTVYKHNIFEDYNIPLSTEGAIENKNIGSSKCSDVGLRKAMTSNKHQGTEWILEQVATVFTGAGLLGPHTRYCS